MRACVVRSALVFLSTLALFSAQAQDRWVFQDAGQPRTFTLALDEVAVSTPTARRALTAAPTAASTSDMKKSVRSLSRTTGQEVELVLYEIVDGVRKGAPRIVTAQVLVTLEAGTDAESLLKNAGAITVIPAGYGLENTWLAQAEDSAAALDLATTLAATPGVLSAEPQLARQQSKRLFPNDTFFTNQWHLSNTGQFHGTAKMDVRVTNVWDTYRGSGMYIAIIDDGLQVAHPDLSANAETTIDYDINYSDNDPSPDISGDDHGTSCAGVAAARGNNGIGVSGAAPEAKLVGLRLISAAASDSDEALALGWSNSLIQVKSNSWGPNDDGITLEGPGTAAAAAMSNACISGRSGRGVLIFWAGGNGLLDDDDSNYDGYANSIYSIAIAAADIRGFQSWYSEPGANIVVCAPSNGDNPTNTSQDIGIWTVDRTGSDGYNDGSTSGEPSDSNYTATFGGTSSASPLAAGVGALILQSNTNLGWRDVQEILIRSATRNDSSDSDWRTNGVGFWFNHKYGGGLINASGAVAMASTWTNLGAEISTTTNQSYSTAIPDNNASGITRTFNITSYMRMEHAVVTLSATHPYRGNLKIELISPANTTSVLANAHSDSGDNYSSWKFMTVRNWGESSAGTWTLRVADRTSSNTGTLTFAGLTLYGTAGETPSNQPPVLASIGNKSVVASNTLSFAVTASDPVDGDTISLTASNLPAGAVFGSTNGIGSFLWTNANPIGVYTCSFYATDNDGVNSETITINVNDGSCIPTNVLTENFDSSTSVPAGWTDGGTANDTASHYQSAPNCRALGTGDTLITPAVDSPTQLVFYTDSSSGGNGQTATVDYSINGGAYAELGSFSVTTAGKTVTFALTSSPDLSAAENVTFRFNSSFNTWYLDDVVIDAGCGGTPAADTPPVLSSIGNKSTTISNALSFSVSATPTDGDTVTLTASNLPSGAVFGSTNENGAFTWSSPAPVGVYTCSFYATDNDGVDSETITITVQAASIVDTNCGMIISEYIEGTSNNKALELFNGTGSSIDLAAGSYVIQQYNNGSTSQTYVMGLTGTVAAGATFVIANNSASNYITSAANLLTSSQVMTFNGDDTLVLRSGGTNGVIIDSFGQLGTDPGTEWGSGLTSTADNTLRRKSSISHGRTAPTDSFDPSTEWDGYAANTYAGLGSHSNVCVGGGAPAETPPVFNTTTNQSVVVGGTIAFTVSAAPTDSDTVTLTASNLPAGAAFGSTNEFGYLLWTNASPIGVYTSYFYATDNDGVVSTNVIITILTNDTDADGIDDAWEQNYFGSLTNVSASSDWDGDGFLDHDEYLAGTIPTSSNSLLKLTQEATQQTGAGIVIRWQSASNRVYVISRSTNLLTGFSTLTSGLSATPPENIFTDAAPAAAHSLYRIDINLP